MPVLETRIKPWAVRVSLSLRLRHGSNLNFICKTIPDNIQRSTIHDNMNNIETVMTRCHIMTI
jgi:hypothetical protein